MNENVHLKFFIDILFTWVTVGFVMERPSKPWRMSSLNPNE